MSLIIAAIKERNVPKVLELLKDPKLQSTIAAENNRVLSLAAGHGLFAVVEELLRYPAVVDKIADSWALIEAVLGGYYEIVQLLLKSSPAVADMVAEENNLALVSAADEGYYEIVQLLLTYPEVVKNIAAEENEALRCAADKGYLDIVQLLLTNLEVVKNIAAKDNYALKIAAVNGHLDVVKELLSHQEGRSDAANLYSLLQWAAKQEHHQLCHVIVDACWGNIGNVPENFKNHRDWPKVNKSIREGESEHANEDANSAYILDDPETLQRRIKEYMSSTSMM